MSRYFLPTSAEFNAGIMNGVTAIYERTDEGEDVPVALVTQLDEKFPFDKIKLTKNLIDLVNGREPLHRVENLNNDKIFYSWVNDKETDERLGLLVKWMPEGEGVAKDGLLIRAGAA